MPPRMGPARTRTPEAAPAPEAASPASGPEWVRVRVDAAYDGGGFSGWARQPGRRTVQQVLEDALGVVLRLPAAPALTVAGRTDAGVHARGQVAHFDVPAPCWEEAGQTAHRRLAGLLPEDVRVWRLTPVPADFDARFCAVWRRYAYRVCDTPSGADPLGRHQTLWHRHPLDLEAMNEAGRLCVGEHDFAAFCRRREGATTVRALLRLEWERQAPGLAVAAVVADAFCHHMVRALIGALLRVGEGSKPVRWPAQVLASRARDPAVRVLPPHGLCLEEVGYPPPPQWAARAKLTRRVRPALASSAGPAGPPHRQPG